MRWLPWGFVGSVALVLSLSSFVHSARAADEPRFGPAVSLLDKLTPDGNNVLAEKTPNGIRISSKTKKDLATLHSIGEYKTPLVITAVVATDSKNIRLYYGDKGRLIFNWEQNGTELRHHNPVTGDGDGVPNKGAVPTGKFVTIRWTITEKGDKVEVDGDQRATFTRDYTGISGKVGIGTYEGAQIVVKSFTVATAAAGKKEQIADSGPISIDVSVPATMPAEDYKEPPLVDSDAIERPDFQDKPKRLVKSLTSITAMGVRVADDGEETGFASDIIATVSPQSRRGETAGAGFFRVDGDESMKSAFDEAVRAVSLRYPLWTPGHIDVSFGDKSIGHGGPSAGTAFALLMLSTLEGFEIDPKCAVTGDISVDWKVRKIGGTVAKIHGAALDGCLYAAIPEANASAVSDMALLSGHSSLWEIQTLSIGTLQEAQAMVRKDRAAPLTEALKLFAGLQPQLSKGDRAALQDPAVQATLKHILELAPNHLSAKALLEISQGTFPKTLSDAATYYNIGVILYPYRNLFENADDPIGGVTVPEGLAAMTRKRLDSLRAISSKDLLPLVSDVAAFIETANSIAIHSVPVTALKPRLQAVAVRLNTISTDPKFVGNLVRDGF